MKFEGYAYIGLNKNQKENPKNTTTVAGLIELNEKIHAQVSLFKIKLHAKELCTSPRYDLLDHVF